MLDIIKNSSLITKILLFLAMAGSIYFFIENKEVFAVVCLLFFILMLIEELRREYTDELILIKNMEKLCNCEISIDINLTALLKDKKVEKALKDAKLFDRKFKIKNWQETLLANYKAKYKNEGESIEFSLLWSGDAIIENVRFRIKGGQLWKNGQYEFGDVINHSIFLAYDKKDIKKDWGIGIGLNIRLLVVNGLLKLQVGEFSSGANPDAWNENNTRLKNTELAKEFYYTSYVTVTEFPFWNKLITLKIPEKYLNFSLTALGSYEQLLRGEIDQKKIYSDWSELVKQRQLYANFSCYTDYNEDEISSLSEKKRNEIKNFFHEIIIKKSNTLSQNGFSYDDGVYTNPFLSIYTHEYLKRWEDYKDYDKYEYEE